MGHSALIVQELPDSRPYLAVTGPRRAMLRGSRLDPYFAVPHGDMMLARLLRAAAGLRGQLPETAAAIEGALAGRGADPRGGGTPLSPARETSVAQRASCWG